MGTGRTPPVDEARSIFDDLGYTVSGDGRQFRAERGWKVVTVTATEGPPADPAGDGGLHCFVTWRDAADGLRRRLARADPDGEWAVIAVEDGADYEVLDPPVAGA